MNRAPEFKLYLHFQIIILIILNLKQPFFREYNIGSFYPQTCSRGL